MHSTLILVVVSFVCLSCATDWYVSPTGNDNSAGTETSPFKTLTGALQHVDWDDTIVLLEGAYSGTRNQNIQITKNVTITSQVAKILPFLMDKEITF